MPIEECPEPVETLAFDRLVTALGGNWPTAAMESLPLEAKRYFGALLSVIEAMSITTSEGELTFISDQQIAHIHSQALNMPYDDDTKVGVLQDLATMAERSKELTIASGQKPAEDAASFYSRMARAFDIYQSRDGFPCLFDMTM